VSATTDDKTDTELATEIISLLGGAKNIDSVVETKLDQTGVKSRKIDTAIIDIRMIYFN
jgi:PTS system D-glucosamine-specific IIC component